jgi:hypothetical protein
MWIALTGVLPAELFISLDYKVEGTLSCGYYVHKHDLKDTEILLVHF